MRLALNFLFLVVISLFAAVKAQERPPINIYQPEDYGAESQNWAISQSDDRYIYVANNRGLLEYDGAKWCLYSLPSETIIRSVAVIDSLIYTGSYLEFGYWKKDDYGILNYTSLSDELNVDFHEDEEFWDIEYLDNWVLFQSLDRIHVYNKNTASYNVIDSPEGITRLFKVAESFYFQNPKRGLFKVENGKGVLVSDNEVFKDNVIVNIFKDKNELLVLSRDDGFFKLTEDNNMAKWEVSSDKILKEVSVFSGAKLSDDSFVLGTISDGVICLSPEGNIKYEINQSNGLTNNTILSLYEDVDSNIWLGLDNGINCINAKSPYNVYFDKKGRIGSVYASIVHRDHLYLGTNQGLFYKRIGSEDEFQFIKGTQGQVWFLGVFNSALLCGHNSGTFQIDGGEVRKLSNIQGAWLIKPIESNPDLLIQGNYDGLNVLENKNGLWQFKNKLQGFNLSSRYFEFVSNDVLFVNHEYKGLFKLRLNDGLTKVEALARDTFMEKGLYSSLIKYQREVLYTNRKGVFKYSSETKRFEKDSFYSKLIHVKEFSSGKLVADTKSNKLWSFSSRGLNHITSSKLSGEKKIYTIPFPVDIRKDVIGYENITFLNDDKYLLGSKSGFTILDLSITEVQSHVININQIELSRFKNQDSTKLINRRLKGEFDNKENNVRFFYSISEFLKTQKPEYQYKLEGMYDAWSDWTTNASVLFENLPYGDYNFSVKGRVGNQETLNTASFSFEIKRPWYLSTIALVFYVFLFLLFLLLMHSAYRTYYRNQRRRLLLKKTREFNIKELQNKQELMRFKNERLREDIESKNRELGISTMNLIKKNEFLSSIKKELENAENVRSLKQVIKIIDRNLNNNDDWNLFQEAFNNADKDFLKKIKSLHPNLTSNDLRLCAYLRLNLSSKEIAPLLNISPRSVEVKRYRLRKKMELPHEANLSDYILEI